MIKSPEYYQKLNVLDICNKYSRPALKNLLRDMKADLIEQQQLIDDQSRIITAYYLELVRFENWVDDDGGTRVSSEASKAVERLQKLAQELKNRRESTNETIDISK